MKSLKPMGIALLAGFTFVLTACGGTSSLSDIPIMETPSGEDVCDYPAPVSVAFEPQQGPLVITEADHAVGPDDALVTLQFYSDYACEYCADLYDSLQDVLPNYDDVRIVYRPLPLLTDNSFIAAQAAESVAAQAGLDAFIEFGEMMYDSQGEWPAEDEGELLARMSDYAESVGADPDQMAEDVSDGVYIQAVVASAGPAVQAGIESLPLVFVNAQPYNPPPQAPVALDAIIGIGLTEQTYHELPPLEIDPAGAYRAWIETTQGTLIVDLYAEAAPQTVNNFAYLACEGYYEGIYWHRVIPGFVAQAGDPSGTGIGGPGYGVPDEYTTDAYTNAGLTFADGAGLLSMAKSNAPNSAGSQFFITLEPDPADGPATYLDEGFTIFGRVVAGQDVAEALAPYQSSDFTDDFADADQILSITVRRVD